MPRTKETLFITLLVFITFLNLLDLYNDMQETDHSKLHMILEAGIILVSLSGISFLIREIRQRRREIDALLTQLKTTRADLTDLQKAAAEKMRQASRTYSDVIQQQLAAWEFTPSEKEVALLLLKGLSFDEIATVRDTKEKTVRQQATAIYRKSSLSGRHEFAAWFFEDFLQ